jgi:hypothetical protein
VNKSEQQLELPTSQGNLEVERVMAYGQGRLTPIQIIKNPMQNRTLNPAPSIIARVHSTERAFAHYDVMHEPHSGSGEQTIQHIFHV